VAPVARLVQRAVTARSPPKMGQFAPPFGQICGVAYTRGCVQGLRTGSVHMIRLVIDVVLFSCMTAFVAGVVIAAAHFVI
jgi:hypothetical protein